MISIIVPTLNEEKYLPRLLKSIEKQKFDGDLEIIVADANSKDRTKEIAQEFGCNIVRGGLAAKGRNEGAKAAKGELLFFVDADILLPKGFLKNVLEKFKKNSLDMATFLIFPDKKRTSCILFFKVFNFITRIIPLAFMGTILIKRDVHKRINGFDEEIKLAEDHDYLWRARHFGKHKRIKDARIYGSIRRFEKDGMARTSAIYLLAGIYILIFGPIKKNIFNYKLNHYDN
ncbi:MAG: glycosyltransferase [Patescibacteria group bacterium]|nr:glycosyltransferase [Patescibacteria group bacterium]